MGVGCRSASRGSRPVDDTKEFQLDSYQEFASHDLLVHVVLKRMLAGVHAPLAASG